MTEVSQAVQEIVPFSIVPWMYEKDLDKKYGVEIGKLENGIETGLIRTFERNIPFKGGYYNSISEINKKILKKYKSIPGFCSMKIKNKKDLEKHTRNLHELSYNHYLLKLEQEFGFPSYCCYTSSIDLFFSLLKRGYPNSSIFGNWKGNHAYLGLPFLLDSTQQRGFLIIDPTSDQLFHNKRVAPKNNIFVSLGEEWIYETDWGNGKNLYPSKEDDSAFSNLHTLREVPNSSVHESKDLERFFKEVFENPVEVDPIFFN